jgi:G3E family GTPase
MSSDMLPIPVILLTGFLGAGKTTLLNALLRDPAFADTAVLINELGEMAIDHDLIAEFNDDLVTSTTGCLCCQASSDLKRSLFDLWTRRRNGETPLFRRVLVETTGLVDPVPVLSALLAPPVPPRPIASWRPRSPWPGWSPCSTPSPVPPASSGTSRR